MKRFVILLIMSLFSLARAGAQYYDTGQDPASLRWLQIRTPHFRIIYPDDFGGEAFRYARLLEESFEKLSVLYPGVRTNIPVIIHNHSMQSNGYVSWAPRRMELYPLPGQDNLPMHPAAQLAVHETVHMLQLGSLNSRGFGRALRFILGEHAVGLSAVMIPLWAFEGDAVYAETATTPSGRGRSNAFIRGAMALSLKPGGIYGYDKMLSGSYRNFTPNHYVFGYLMMNHLRTIDPDAWNEVYRIASNGLPGNPVNAGLRKETRLTKRRLYDATFAALGKSWRESMPEGVKEYTPLSLPGKRNYVSHYTPHRMDDGRIISLRTSLSDPSRFVITGNSGGKELNITTTGYIYPCFFSFSGNTIVWAEQYPDIRWDNRDYSVIKRLDLPDGLITDVTSRTRYTAPDLSPDGRTIVAVSTTPDMVCSLVFLDSHTGEVLMDLVPPDGLILQRPAWSSDGRQVTMVTLNQQGEGIRTYRPTGKKWTVNLEESHTDIVQAKIHNDTLFFLAQGDGSDNIYRIAGSGPVERVTGSRFGISGFSVRGSELLFSDYTADGFVIASEKSSATAGPAFMTGHEILPPVAPMPGEAPEKEPPQQVAPIPGTEPAYEQLPQVAHMPGAEPAKKSLPQAAPTPGAEPEKEPLPEVTPNPGGAPAENILPDVTSPPADDSVSDATMPLIAEPGPYRKIANLFNPHSWLPFYADLDEIRTDPATIRPGLTLMSQNHLSTLISTVGYEYSEGNHYLHSGITWKGWCPVIDAEIKWGGEQLIISDTSATLPPENPGTDLQLNLSIYDQLWFARGKFRQMVMPALYISYRNRDTWLSDENRYDRDVLTLTGRFYFSNIFRTAYRDINPKWGQVFDLQLTTTPWDTKLYSSKSYARTILFFPGALPNHSLSLRVGRENQAPARKHLYRNKLPWPRGYDHNLVAEKLLSFSADYTMPLFYPDLAAGSFLYLKRIRGTLFYDYSKGVDIRNYADRSFHAGPKRFCSAGSELMADFYLLRIPFEISAGIQAGYMPYENRYFVNGAFSVNIYGTVLGRER